MNILALYKKWSFPLRISSVNVTKSAVRMCSVGKQKNSQDSSFLLMDLNEEPIGLIISGSVE